MRLTWQKRQTTTRRRVVKLKGKVNRRDVCKKRRMTKEGRKKERGKRAKEREEKMVPVCRIDMQKRKRERKAHNWHVFLSVTAVPYPLIHHWNRSFQLSPPFTASIDSHIRYRQSNPELPLFFSLFILLLSTKTKWTTPLPTVTSVDRGQVEEVEKERRKR